MAGERTLKLTILGDAKKAVDALRQVDQQADRTGGRLEQVNQRFGRQIKLATAVGAAAVTAFTVKGIEAASNLREAQNKANETFEDSIGVVQEFARTSADAYGQSERAALQYTSQLGLILQASGLTREESAKMSVDLSKLASDFASFHNIGVDEALEKIRAGLVGEAEPLRQLGILLSADAVKAKALEMGLVGANGELTEGAKVQARYALILEQSAAAQGDFARTADDLENAKRRLAARVEDLSAKFGRVFLPLITDILGVLLKLPDEVLLAAGTIVAIGTAIGGVLIVLPLLVSGITTLIALGPALGAAITLATGPFGLIAVAIAGAIAAGVLIVKNWDEIKAAAGRLFGFIKDVFSRLAGWFRDAFVAVMDNNVAKLALLFTPAGPLVAIWHFRDHIMDIFGAVRDFVVGAFNAMIGIIEAFIGAVGRVKDAIADLPTPGDVAGKLPGAGSGAADVLGKVAGFAWDVSPAGITSNLIGKLPGFAQGGIIPGPIGAPRLVMAHGGETILPTHRRGGGAGTVIVNIHGSVISTQHEIERLMVRALNDARAKGGF